jgi:hypothetical protein
VVGIRDPEKCHLGSGSQILVVKQHRIPDPGPQHCGQTDMMDTGTSVFIQYRYRYWYLVPMLLIFVCSGRSAAQAEIDALKVKTSKLQEELAALKLAEKVRKVLAKYCKRGWSDEPCIFDPNDTCLALLTGTYLDLLHVKPFALPVHPGLLQAKLQLRIRIRIHIKILIRIRLQKLGLNITVQHNRSKI